MQGSYDDDFGKKKRGYYEEDPDPNPKGKKNPIGYACKYCNRNRVADNGMNCWEQPCM